MLGVSRYAVFLVVLVCSYTVYAQESQSDTKRLTDLRVELVHAALQLTPEQEKYWPALEEAIRARSAGRLQRVAALQRLRDQKDVPPLDLLRQRADNLNQRGTELKKLVDAWQPLNQTLNPEQKERMGILIVTVLRVVKRGAQARMMEMDEDDEAEE